MTEKETKALAWIASSKRDFMQFPEDIRKEMGHALYIAQQGGKHRDAKPLKGFKSAKVLEIVEKGEGGTYRTTYTVQFEEIVYVLHAFQKKSKTGTKTAKQDIDLVETRIKWAQQKHQEWQAARRGN
jgi:phage-related protein